MSLDDNELTNCCNKFDKTFTFDISSDVDLNDLIFELKILQLTLTDRQMSVMEIFEFVREVDSYPNVVIAYRILFTIPNMVAPTSNRKEFLDVEIIEELFEVYNLSRKIKWFVHLMF